MSVWKTVTLGDLADPKQWPTLSKAKMQETGYPVYGANGRIGFANTFTHARPTILIGCRGSCGTVHVTEPLSYANGNAMALDELDESRVDRRFLAHFFRLRGFRDVTTGTSQPQIIRQNLVRMEIPLPPLAEQRRIAEVLDRADVLRAKRRATMTQLDSLAESIFFDLFGDHRQTPVTIGDELDEHPSGWHWELLTDVGRLATGHTPDRKRPDYWNGDIPWITLTEIRRLDGRVAERTEQNITEAGIENSSAVKLPAGTVCLSRTASVGFVTVMGRDMATSQDFVNWVCGPRLDSTYLMHAFLRSRARLRLLSTGSTHKTIYFPTVQQFRVLVPPLALQKDFVRRVGAVEKLKIAHCASLTELDSLFAALRHRAFREAL